MTAASFAMFPIRQSADELVRSPLTLAVIAATVTFVAVTLVRADLGRALEAWTTDLARGEWWRLATYLLPHTQGLPHAGINMLLVYLYGSQLERAVGSLRFGLVYVG